MKISTKNRKSYNARVKKKKTQHKLLLCLSLSTEHKGFAPNVCASNKHFAKDSQLLVGSSTAQCKEPPPHVLRSPLILFDA